MAKNKYFYFYKKCIDYSTIYRAYRNAMKFYKRSNFSDAKKELKTVTGLIEDLSGLVNNLFRKSAHHNLTKNLDYLENLLVDSTSREEYIFLKKRVKKELEKKTTFYKKRLDYFNDSLDKEELIFPHIL